MRQRQTLKVLADENEPWPVSDFDIRSTMSELIDVAGSAPYHYPCDPSQHHAQLDSPAPWRCFALDTTACRSLLTYVKTLDEPLGKIGSMLAAADGLVMVTWLPDPPAESDSAAFQSFEPTKRNMEHIAAASAAVQNILLAATERGMSSYWSSGGAVLRGEAVYDHLAIPKTQVLLAAVFLFPKETHDAALKPGANRGKCGPASRWMRWIEETREPAP